MAEHRQLLHLCRYGERSFSHSSLTFASTVLACARQKIQCRLHFL